MSYNHTCFLQLALRKKRVQKTIFVGLRGVGAMDSLALDKVD